MKSIWVIGAGTMAQEYIKVLKALDCDFTVIGRSTQSALICEEASKCQVIFGGLNTFLKQVPQVASHAIVSVGVEKLFEATKELLEYGIKNILVEKPAGLHQEEFKQLTLLTKEKQANVYVAYNRRFYASVIKAQNIIEEDGGVTSFNFEFTEWEHVIAPLQKAAGVKEKWFLSNSTHVVDLAFFLGGKPKELSSFTQGSLDWHTTASVFSGAGISINNALFSYQANWESAGRWSVEILTKEHRLILCPMEKLKIQKRASIAQELDDTIDYTLDDKYKPGLYLQVDNFLNYKTDNLCNIEEQYQMQNIYAGIANYTEQV
ncbi:MAG: gfo/Idh/MocA family oxidoreductase [Desulfobulbus sp.]|nr:MAG: gfo/Idh/MocA family oxidoreductase [Desulfobulbus sp.]